MARARRPLRLQASAVAVCASLSTGSNMQHQRRNHWPQWGLLAALALLALPPHVAGEPSRDIKPYTGTAQCCTELRWTECQYTLDCGSEPPTYSWLSRAPGTGTGGGFCRFVSGAAPLLLLPDRDRYECGTNCECTPCAGNQYEVAPPYMFEDRVCKDLTNCGPGSYVSVEHTPSSDRICAPYTTCKPGERVSVAGTGRTDRECAACPAGKSTGTNNMVACMCHPTFSRCEAGEERKGECNSWLQYEYDMDSTYVCEACEANKYNGAISARLAVPCTPCHDAPDSTCGAGQKRAGECVATGASYKCQDCDPGTFSEVEDTSAECETCASGEFSSEPRAEKCTKCEPGSFTDTKACTACPPGTWDHDADLTTACEPHTKCGPGMHTSAAGTATADPACTDCPLDTYKASESTHTTTVEDPGDVCRPQLHCVAGDYWLPAVAEPGVVLSASARRRCYALANETLGFRSGCLAYHQGFGQGSAETQAGIILKLVDDSDLTIAYSARPVLLTIYADKRYGAGSLSACRALCDRIESEAATKKLATGPTIAQSCREGCKTYHHLAYNTPLTDRNLDTTRNRACHSCPPGKTTTTLDSTACAVVFDHINGYWKHVGSNLGTLSISLTKEVSAEESKEVATSLARTLDRATEGSESLSLSVTVGQQQSLTDSNGGAASKEDCKDVGIDITDSQSANFESTTGTDRTDGGELTVGSTHTRTSETTKSETIGTEASLSAGGFGVQASASVSYEHSSESTKGSEDTDERSETSSYETTVTKDQTQGKEFTKDSTRTESTNECVTEDMDFSSEASSDQSTEDTAETNKEFMETLSATFEETMDRTLTAMRSETASTEVSVEVSCNTPATGGNIWQWVVDTTRINSDGSGGVETYETKHYQCVGVRNNKPRCPPKYCGNFECSCCNSRKWAPPWYEGIDLCPCLGDKDNEIRAAYPAADSSVTMSCSQAATNGWCYAKTINSAMAEGKDGVNPAEMAKQIQESCPCACGKITAPACAGDADFFVRSTYQHDLQLTSCDQAASKGLCDPSTVPQSVLDDYGDANALSTDIRSKCPCTCSARASPCSAFVNSPEACGNDLTCEFDARTKVCRPSACGQHTSAGACELPCEYNTNKKMCTRAKAIIQCSDYTLFKDCELQPKCEYNTTARSCQGSGKSGARCSDFDGDYAQCQDNEEPACAFDVGDGACSAAIRALELPENASVGDDDGAKDDATYDDTYDDDDNDASSGAPSQKKKAKGSSAGLAAGLVVAALLLAGGGAVLFKKTKRSAGGKVAPSAPLAESKEADLEKQGVPQHLAPATRRLTSAGTFPLPHHSPIPHPQHPVAPPAQDLEMPRGQCSRCGEPVLVSQERDRNGIAGGYFHTNPKDCSALIAGGQ